MKTLCLSCFSIVVIKTLWPRQLRKIVLGWAHSFRKVRVHQEAIQQPSCWLGQLRAPILVQNKSRVGGGMSFFETSQFASSDRLLPTTPHFLIFPFRTVPMTGDQYSNPLVLGVLLIYTATLCYFNLRSPFNLASWGNQQRKTRWCIRITESPCPCII